MVKRPNKRDTAAESALRSFFLASVTQAVESESLDVTGPTRDYLVELLTCFAFPSRLHHKTPSDLTLRPLADYYADYIEETSVAARKDALRRMGDAALFTAGMFPDYFTRRVVDIDHYIGMGEGAYSSLSSLCSRESRSAELLFAELAEKFRDLVDILDAVGEGRGGNGTLLRAYERWLHTRTPRAARRLETFGLAPAAGSASTSRH